MENNSQSLPHKAGFVSIIGKPNVGKSTLMNAIMGERLSIISSKAQTTRHRIMGIFNGERNGQEFQIVYSDTPGIIKPHYELHKRMMQFVKVSLEDADVILFLADLFEEDPEEEVLKRLVNATVPVFMLVNKIDLGSKDKVNERIAYWQDKLKNNSFGVIQVKETIPVSALTGFNIEKVFDLILENLPEHPAYYPKDEFTDKPERFFAAEMIREKIFLNHTKEIPYSCEVIITSFKEEENIIRISAEILVERKTQRGILIGKGGEKLKKVGTQAREDMEQFFQKKVFLEQFVKVEPDWRNKKNKLEQFGYNP